jgi:hypothetical protein
MLAGQALWKVAKCDEPEHGYVWCDTDKNELFVYARGNKAKAILEMLEEDTTVWWASDEVKRSEENILFRKFEL